MIPAGIVPYFTRLQAFDLLGKSDAHVAHLPPKKGALLGHGKIDPEYTLRKRPDYVISCSPRSVARNIQPLPPEGSTDYLWTLLAAQSFRGHYEPNPVPDPFLLERTGVYVRGDSPELPKLATWRSVTVSR